MKVSHIATSNILRRLKASVKIEAMAQRIPPGRTGIEGVILWTSDGEGARHAPRVKVSNIKNKFDDKDNFTIMLNGKIRGKPKLSKIEVKRCVQFVLLNSEAISEFWNNPQMDPVELMDKLKKV